MDIILSLEENGQASRMTAGIVDDSVDERRKTRRFFNRAALAFLVIDRRLGPQYRRALEVLSFKADQTVLDLGTGTGTLAQAFAERGHQVTGIDFADRLLRKARRKVPSGEFHSKNLVDLDTVSAKSYDIVSLAYVLHGLSPNLRDTTLHHAARLSRGRVLIFDYRCSGPWYVRLIEQIEGPHYAEFVENGIEDQVGAHNVVVENSGSTSDYGGWWLCSV